MLPGVGNPGLQGAPSASGAAGRRILAAVRWNLFADVPEAEMETVLSIVVLFFSKNGRSKW